MQQGILCIFPLVHWYVVVIFSSSGKTIKQNFLWDFSNGFTLILRCLLWEILEMLHIVLQPSIYFPHVFLMYHYIKKRQKDKEK